MLFLALAGLASACGNEESAEPGGYEFSTDWTSAHAEQWSKSLAKFKGKPDVEGLEIGCFEGRTSIWLLENIATDPTAGMTCIDVFTEPMEKRFDHNIRVAGFTDKITKLKGYSQDVLRTLDYDSFDFVYIDGCHRASCVLSDAVMAWDLLKPGGIIIFDDYLLNLKDPPTERPKIAIDAFLANYQDRLDVLSKEYQVIVEKTSPRSNKSLVGEPVVQSPEWEKKYQESAARKKKAKKKHPKP